MRLWIVVASMLVIITSCKKEKNIKPVQSPKHYSSGVLVGNEGNFNWNNASLSFYCFKDGKTYNGIYKSSNGKVLGDVLQSIYVREKEAFLIVNNSSKIVEIDLNNFKEIKTFEGLTSPRYMFLNGKYAFVSDLYSKSISVLDITKNGKNAIVKTIPVNGWTEQMAAKQNYLYVTGVEANHVYVIDMVRKALIDSISTADAPMSLAFDKYGFLWVYCGDYKSDNYVLEKINVSNKNVELSIVLSDDDDQYATKMAINKSHDKIWFLYDGVKTISVDDSIVYDFIQADNFTTPYGIGVDNGGKVYVADAKDYQSNGEVYVYDSLGVLLNNFSVGIIPGSFAFYYSDDE